MTNTEGHPAVVLGNVPEETYYKDFGALQWSFDNAKNAGLGTSTMPNASGFYIPLITGNGTLGVLGAYPKGKDRLFTFDEIASMETLASLLASALERVRAGEVAQQSMVEKENKRLRETLMSAFTTEDLASSSYPLPPLSMQNERLHQIGPQNIALSISEESSRLRKTAINVIEASSLQLGTIHANRVPSSVSDRVEAALVRLGARLTANEVVNNISTDLPDVLIDATLIEQLIFNILENALRFSPPHTAITIEAARAEGDIRVMISDQGPGIDKALIGRIFDQTLSQSSETQGHAGLGLTISAGIVRLHGGRIWAENRPAGGARISFTLPLA